MSSKHDHEDKESKQSNIGMKMMRLCFYGCCMNKYHILRIFSLLITLFVVIVSLLYSCAAVYDLSLSSIWCNDGKLITCDEVVSHNIMLEYQIHMVMEVTGNLHQCGLQIT